MCYRKYQERSDRKQDHRVAHDAIPELLVPGRSKILFHCHRIHIPRATAVQITSRRVVNGMLMLPIIKRGEHKYAHYHPHQIIDSHGAKERTVKTIVKDDEQTYHEP